MTLSELKSGFFGYRKTSVYQYITSLEEQFSSKLMEQEAQARKDAEQYQQRIQQLEEELAAIREQYETQRSQQLVVADTLLDAQRWAGQLRQEAEEQRQQASQQLEEEVGRQNRELERYRAQVQALREAFRSTLQELDGQAAKLEEQVDETLAAAPDHNLSLFQRRTGPEA